MEWGIKIAPFFFLPCFLRGGGPSMAPPERRPPRPLASSFCVRRAKALARQNGKRLAQGGIHLLSGLDSSFSVFCCFIFCFGSSAPSFEGGLPSLQGFRGSIEGGIGFLHARQATPAPSGGQATPGRNAGGECRSECRSGMQVGMQVEMQPGLGRNGVEITNPNSSAMDSTLTFGGNALEIANVGLAVMDSSLNSVSGEQNVSGEHNIMEDEEAPSFRFGTPVDRLLDKELGSIDGSVDSSDKEKEMEKNNDRSSGKRTINTAGIKDLDPKLVDKVNSAGSNASEAKDEWARGRFDAWRIRNNLPIDRSVEEIPQAELADMLEKFILCVHRQDGVRYPPPRLVAEFVSYVQSNIEEKSRVEDSANKDR